jgi:hypothetical protein
MTNTSDTVSQYVDVAAEAGEQLISAIKELQDQSLSVIESIAEQVNSTFADFPGANLFPTSTSIDPAKGVELFFGFAEKALELQKSYLLRLSGLPSSTSVPATPAKKTAATTAQK